MRRLLALKDLIHDFVEKTTDLVEEQHESVAKKSFGVLEAAPPLEDAARAVNEARRLTTAAVFDTIRATNQGVRLAEDAGIALARSVAKDVGLFSAERLALPGGAAPAPSRLARIADLAQGALNGVMGDFLKARENGLGIEMTFREAGGPLPLEPEALARALPRATDKLCIFVHGLACTEWAWSLLAEEMHGDRDTTLGTLLEKDLGYTSLYVRYNTGLHVSENGRALAELIAALVGAHPVAVRRVVLVGHSMGGLVARSAAHYGREHGASWTSLLSHVVTIGSPHLGAPLEKAGNVLAAVLGFFDVPGTQVPAKILNARSAGVKDLRFGYVLDEDWHGRDPDALLQDNRNHAPFLDSVVYGFVASTLTRDPNHPVGRFLGDVLVRLPSAAGVAEEPARNIPFHVGKVIGGANHFELMNHPAVYAELLRCLAISLPARPAE